MNVLVIGGAGFIGSHTVDRLIENGYDVKILDNLQKPVHLKGKPKYLNPKADFIFGDINDKEVLKNSMKDVDYVFNFAAYQDYLPFFSNFFQTNCVGNSLIYEIAVEEKIKLKKIVVASSQFVNGEGIYKDKNGNIISPPMRSEYYLKKGLWDFRDKDNNILDWQWTPESHSSPPNQYAISKYAQEEMSINFGTRYDIPTVAMRYSIVQGERQSFYNMYSGALRIFSMHYNINEIPVIYEDGEMMRDFVNIHDVVDANIIVLENSDANYQNFNIGGGKAISISDFCRNVAQAYNHNPNKLNIPGLYRFGDTRNACSDISKIKNLNWRPKRDVMHSILSYKEYLQNADIDKEYLKAASKKMKKLNVVRSIGK